MYSENPKKRILKIVVSGLIAAFLGHFIINTKFMLGVLIALPLAIFNFWFVASADINASGDKSQGGVNKVLFRTYLRMFISIAALAIAAKFGVYFVFGVLTALVLQVLTYLKDLFIILVRKG